jgi:hypothetical protein
MSGSPQTWATWSDGGCHMVTVTFTHVGSGPPTWRVAYDKAHQCGNSVMGMGECIGYSVHTGDGMVQVQTIGLSRTDADQLVHSIKL